MKKFYLALFLIWVGGAIFGFAIRGSIKNVELNTTNKVGAARLQFNFSMKTNSTPVTNDLIMQLNAVQDVELKVYLSKSKEGATVNQGTIYTLLPDGNKFTLGYWSFPAQ